jgi:hypothetical protein
LPLSMETRDIARAPRIVDPSVSYASKGGRALGR